ncbi:alpha/beta hydrolase [Micromonospora sp. NPDC051296]|uniref:alpha/beta hydrolase n=1 Tax=Micromonospora sp. NPDC051296 TaxID=3155046 RepID=UPI003427044B
MSTIVLIHGLWVTPRSWEQWIPYYEAKGHRVIAPAYPGFEVEVEALRADPTPVARLTVPETVAHLEKVITALPEKPILIGHSFGGTLTQLLLDRGHGAAGVVIDSAPPEGIRVAPPSQIKSLFPILNNPAKRHRAAGFTAEQWHYAFANTLSEEESRAAYDRYAIPAPGSWVWAYGLIANFKPGKQETWVNFKNNERAPLLFIAGGADHIMPPSVNRSNAEHYKAPDTITEYHEFPDRSHWTCAEPGWQQVADKALEWALRHAR